MMTNTALETLCTTLRTEAAAAVAQYPQYAGHFSEYRLVRVKRNVRTKLGVAFVKGEITIATISPAMPQYDVPERVTAWSVKNRCDTALRASDVEWL